jgi:hypothetical protein
MKMARSSGLCSKNTAKLSHEMPFPPHESSLLDHCLTLWLEMVGILNLKHCSNYTIMNIQVMKEKSSLSSLSLECPDAEFKMHQNSKHGKG